MKTRRAIIHALLSLLLLMSQQIGFAHRISHLSNMGQESNRGRESNIGQEKSQRQSAIQGVGQQSGQLSASLFKQSQVPLSADQSCEQCLFFAQVGSAPTTDVLSFSFGSADSDMFVIGATPVIHPRAIQLFQPRAPPSSI